MAGTEYRRMEVFGENTRLQKVQDIIKALQQDPYTPVDLTEFRVKFTQEQC